ncbi:MAG: FKBP-type peptidyl-prolyl cis-trans isomerase [Candidatus Woesearchaeota archaeon]
MKEVIEKGDFIELDFTGYVENTNEVFDTTIKEDAQKAGIYNEKTIYEPIVVHVGNNQLLKSLEDFLIGKKIGSYEVFLESENAFGKRDSKLLKLISKNNFTKNNIEPVPGLRVNVDGILGTIVSVSSNRVMVDFNHPLAGKRIKYKLIIRKILEDNNEKAKAILKQTLGKETDFSINQKKIKIKLNKEFSDLKPLIIDEFLKIGLEAEFEE